MEPFKMPTAKPATRAQLERRARKHGDTIRKFKRGEDSYMLVDIQYNAVVSNYPLTLAEVEQWLDDLDSANDTTAE